METADELPKWTYSSETNGIGGSIKEHIEDFVVEEQADHAIADDGDVVLAKMKKFHMTTLEAIRELSNVLHVSRKRFGYAGSKDKRAITTQYISVEGLDEEDLQHVFIPDVDLDVLGRGEPIGLGDLDGNSFEIVIRNIGYPEDTVRDRIENISSEMDGWMPNYFGQQRFGSQRPITHEVGREMLKGNYAEAVWTYIAKPSDEEYEKLRKIREELWETREVEKAAEKFPEQNRYEKILLYHLAKSPDDYAGAIKRLPEGLQQMFIHAYQSFIFNEALSALIDDGFDDTDAELPLVGYKTALRDERGDQHIADALEADGIDQDAFKLQDFPHLRTEGEYRACFVPYENFEIRELGSDDLNMNKNKVTVAFDLQKGSYATVFLRELMKNS
jgi:tRNA pseudouridine13 synthase